MRVKIQQINLEGRPATKEQRSKLETYTGILVVRDDRMPRFTRTVLKAELTDPTGDASHPILELYDVTLLWIAEGKMRLRGFEISGLVELGQTWEVEIAKCSA